MKYNSSDYFDPLPKKINHFTPSRIISYVLLGIFIIFCVVGLWIYFLGPINVKKTNKLATNADLNIFPGKTAFIRDFNVWVKINGAEKQITHDAVYSYKSSRPVYTVTYSYPVLSPDGKNVAFFQTKSRTDIKLFMRSLDGKQPKLISDTDTFETPYPVLWFKNSRDLLIETFRSNNGGEHHLVKLNTANGDQTVLAKYFYSTGCGAYVTDPARILGGLDNALPIYTKIFQLSSDNRYVLHNTTCSGYGAGLYDLKAKKDMSISNPITQADFSADGTKFAGITQDGKILVYTSNAAKLFTSLTPSLQPQMLFWSPDGNKLYYTFSTKLPNQPTLGTSYKSALVSITLDGLNEKIIQEFEANAIRPIAFSTDRTSLLVSFIENPTKYYAALAKGDTADFSKDYPTSSVIKLNLSILKKETYINNALETYYR